MSIPRPPSTEAARGCIQVLAWQCENELSIAAGEERSGTPNLSEDCRRRAAALSELAIDVAWFIAKGVFA